MTVLVRCAHGHLFTTRWVPGMSFKALRLGRYRFQRCPVGEHWSFVTPVRDDEMPVGGMGPGDLADDGGIP
jgi:hypothetical protein